MTAIHQRRGISGSGSSVSPSDLSTGLATKPNKNDLPLNARDFGATGDGTTNDATALATAFTAASAAKRPLYLPAGTYLAGSAMTLISNLELYGDGTGTIIKVSSSFASNTWASMVNRTNVRLRDLAFDFNNVAAVGLGMFVQGGSNLNFERVTFSGITKVNGEALRLQGVTDATVLACEIKNATRGLVIAGTAAAGECLRVTVERCKIHDVGENGIYVVGDATGHRDGHRGRSRRWWRSSHHG